MNIVERERPRGRHRPVRRPDAAQAGGAARARRACRSWAPRPTPSTARRTAGASRPPRRARARARPPAPPRARFEEAARIADHHRLPGAGAAVLRAGRARHADRLRRGRTSAELHDGGGAGEPGASHPGRQVPRGRPRDRRGRHRATASGWWWAGSWSTWRRRASTRATPRARCRPTRWATTRSSASRPRPAPSRPSSASSACSTSSSRSRTSRSSCSRSTRAPPARCRSCPRRSGCPWPSSRPG